MILGIKFRFRPEIQFLDDSIENSGRFPQISGRFPQISTDFTGISTDFTGIWQADLAQISPRFHWDFPDSGTDSGWLAGWAGWLGGNFATLLTFLLSWATISRIRANFSANLKGFRGLARLWFAENPFSSLLQKI